MSTWLYLEPLDVLYLRGNKLFGGPGDYAEELMPPWPSVFSGALRSALLARSGVDLGRFTDEEAEHPREDYRHVLGTPEKPGTFRLTGVWLARSGEAGIEPIFPLPADVIVEKLPRRTAPRGPAGTDPEEPRFVRRLRVSERGTPLAAISRGGPGLHLSVLVGALAGKPEGGWWLSSAGWEAYRRGEVPQASQLVPVSELWGVDLRLGIARSRKSYTVEKGRIYTTQAVAMRQGTGFLVEIDGCPAELLREVRLLRLGGDGRGARVDVLAQPPLNRRPEPVSERAALVLLTPGLFPQGWLLPGTRHHAGTYRIECDGFSARLASAVVPRAQVVSGWDLPAHKPKPAQRAVPAGSVYYLDEIEGDVRRYLDNLWHLIGDELIQPAGKDRHDTVWQQRKAEGFNNILVGRWPAEKA